MMTTPFFVNNYRRSDGTTETVDNKVKTRSQSQWNVPITRKLNCRLRVTRLKGMHDENDYAWDGRS